MADDYGTTEDQPGVVQLPPPPPMQTSAYEVEKPNPLLGFLVGALTGRDLLGQQHDAEQAAENAQFWKQTNFAKYQLSKREDLSKEYAATGDRFLSQQASLNQMRVQLGVMTLSKAPPDAIAPLAQSIKDQEAILQHIRDDLAQKRAGVQQIDATMGPMIAHMTPPQSAWAGGQGDAFSKARPGSKSSEIPSNEQGQQAGATMSPQQVAQTPVQHWKQALEDSGLGFPKTRADGSPNGVVVGNRIQYFAETGQQAKDMQDQLDSMQKLPQFGGLRAPVDIVDMEAHQKETNAVVNDLYTQLRPLANKAVYYENLKQTNPKTADLQRMYEMASQNGENERAGNLLTLLNMDEAKRKGAMEDMANQFKDEAAPLRRRIAELSPAVSAYDKNQLRLSGIEVLPPPPGSAETPEGKKTIQSFLEGRQQQQNAMPGMSDKEFRDYYISTRKWDPANPQDWQRRELQAALKAYRASQ